MSAAERLPPHVHRAGPGDEPLLREVRLAALADAPDAFGSTYEAELARSQSDWRRWLSRGATFLLLDGEGAHGIAVGLPDEADGDVVHLLSVWVHPALRGSGAADRLVAAVLGWTAAQGGREVRLRVTEGNWRARRFYERAGFGVTGRSTIRERDGQVELELAARIDAHPEG